MELKFTPEQNAHLNRLAAGTGTRPEIIAENIEMPFLDAQASFLSAVERGLEAASRGEFIDEAEMDARVEAMFPA